MYKLLIVDDEAELRNGIANYFPWNDFGFSVAALASNGEEALAAMAREHIDVVLTDIIMPRMDGIELSEILHREYPAVKIILLSGYMEFEYAQKAIEFSVKRYIVKPTRYVQISDIFSALKLELDDERHLSPKPIDERPADDRKTNHSYYAKIVELAKGYMRTNYSNATLESTAAHVHINPYYLSSLFKQFSSENFSDYLLSVKMERAAELLANINFKIYDISMDVGYANPNNFARAFKRYFSATPREYRNSLCNNQPGEDTGNEA